MVELSRDCTAENQRCVSPMCCFQAQIETRNGLRDVNKFVCKPTKWVTNSKVLAEALYRRCSNISGPPFHRHIVMNGGIAKMASAYAPELVNTVLRALRQQMLNDGWISELELQFAGPSPSEPVFDLKENAANHWADEFDDHTGAQLPGELAHKGKMEDVRWVKEIGLNKNISSAEAKSRGIAIVPFRWVVTDKGDPNRPNVRCRLVGRELRAKTKGTLLTHELFSAMPPWESFKVLLGLRVSFDVSGAEGEELKWLSSTSAELISWRPWIVKHTSIFRRKTNCQKTVKQLVYFCGRCTGSVQQVQTG